MPDETHALGTDPERGVRRQLAGGTALVSVGLTVTGLSTVLMMAVSARSMNAEDYAAFAVWWTVASLLGTSFGVFEVYLARLLIGETAAGRGHGAVTSLMVGRAGVLVAALTLSVLLLAPLLASRLFAGYLGATLLLPAFTALAALQSLQRGACTGRHKFGAIAAQLSTDGLVRMLIIVALVAADLDSVTTLGAACVVASGASLVVGGWSLGGWLRPPRLRGREAAVRPIVFLLVGAVGPLLANNGSVPWLAGTHSVDAYTLGAFAGAVTLSRIPTQFVSAVFSPLLAHLATSVDAGDDVTFRHLRRSAEVVAVILGVVYITAFGLLGPWILTLYLGPDYRLGNATLAVLAAASSGMFIAVVQQAALSALDRWSRIAAAWVAGTVAFLVVLVVPGDTLARATIAPFAGVCVALLAMALFGRGLRADSSSTPTQYR